MGIFVSKATTKGDSTIFVSKAIQPCLFQRQDDDSMRFLWWFGWNTGRGAQNALKLDRMHEIECKGRVHDKSRLQRQRLLRLQRQRLLQRPCASITVGVFVSNMTCIDKIMYGCVGRMLGYRMECSSLVECWAIERLYKGALNRMLQSCSKTREWSLVQRLVQSIQTSLVQRQKLLFSW